MCYFGFLSEPCFKNHFYTTFDEDVLHSQCLIVTRYIASDNLKMYKQLLKIMILDFMILVTNYETNINTGYFTLDQCCKDFIRKYFIKNCPTCSNFKGIPLISSGLVKNITNLTFICLSDWSIEYVYELLICHYTG